MENKHIWSYDQFLNESSPTPIFERESMKTSFTMWVADALNYPRNQNTKDLFLWIKENTPNESFAIDATRAKTGDYTTAQLQIKCSYTDNIQPIINWIEKQKDSHYTITSLGNGSQLLEVEYTDGSSEKPDRIKLIKSGKNLSGITNRPTTKQHETMSLLVFQKFIEEDYSEIESFMDELEEIYPEIDSANDWKTTFQAQGTAMKEWLAGYKGYSYYRDGGFADFINDKARQLGYSSKDNWNPADVWLIKNETEHTKKIKDMDDISFINSYLIEQLKEKEILPISLKKTRSSASVREHNIESDVLKGGKLTFTDISIDLDVPENGGSFKSRDAVIKMSNDTLFQIRFFNPYQLGIEGKYTNAKARFGKVPISYARKLLKDTINLHDWRGEFDCMGKLEKIFNYLQKDPRVETNTKIPYEEFRDRLMLIYEDEQKRVKDYLQKVVVMDTLYKLLSADDPELIMTKFFYAGQKVGDDFGPFIKIS